MPHFFDSHPRERGKKDVFFPLLDYEAHPAFRNLDRSPFSADQAVYQLIDDLDEAARKTVAEGCRDLEEVERLFEIRVVPLIAALRELVLNGTASAAGKRWLALAFEDVLKEMLDEILMRSKAACTPGNSLSVGRGVYEGMSHDGAYMFHIDPDDRQKLRESAESEIRGLYAKRHDTGRIVTTFARYSDTGALLDKIFRQHGVYEALAAYKGDEISFTGFSLEYSHSGQKWWKGCYSDVGLPDSKTTYMHYDHGCRYPKAIVTLNEVTEDNGPTHFVRGSHHARRSPFVHTFIKSLDLKFFDAFESSRSGQDQYYRHRFAEPRYRKVFMELPKAFQSCSHFGEDILDGSELSSRLLADEIRLTSDRGHGIVFDGDYGIHRGANVRDGERLAFQVVFTVARPASMVEQAYRRSRFLARKWLNRMSASVVTR